MPSIILRVGTQMLDKGFTAFIARFCCNLDHLGADAGDLAQAEFVDLLGIQVGGRFLTDAEIIIIFAARLRGYARSLGAIGFVAFCKPVEMFLQRRMDDRCDGRACFGSKTVEFGFAHAFGPTAMVRAHVARFTDIGVGYDQARNALFVTVQHHTWENIFALQCFVCDRQRLVVDRAILLQPGVVAFIVRLVAKGQIVRHPGKVLMPARIG